MAKKPKVAKYFFTDDFDETGYSGIVDSVAGRMIIYCNLKQAVVLLPHLNSDKKSMYNEKEMAHIAVNYAITCMKGYDGSFDDWFNRLDSKWRDIANKDE